MSFFGELRRRNVVKVAVAYAIVGWVLIEVSTTVLPVFEAPDWIAQVFTFFVILGFPLALILSWAYEITPEGIKLERDVAAGESITHVTGRKIDFAIIGALVLALGFVIYNYESGDSSDQVARTVLPNSVAVLPFENLSLDPEDAFFATGIHEEILNQLAKLSELNVIARTSMMQYAGRDKSIPRIAAELNVETVMEGSVRYADGRVLVTAQLIDPETNAHLWSDSYNREFADVFAVQSDIAMNIANALEAEFSLAEQESIETVPTDSPDAYRLYLLAGSIGGNEEGIDRATPILDRAIELDPNFALALSRKAIYHAWLLAGNVPARQAEFERIAQDSAERALALDETQAWSHAALGWVHLTNWRWAEAEAAFERAIELRPNSAAILNTYSRIKRYRGDYDEAVRTSRRSAELNPNSSGVRYQLGINYRYARDYDAAADSFRHALELNPAELNAHAQLGYTEVSRGNWDEALIELRLAEQRYGDGIIALRFPQLANAYAQMGREDDVQRLFDALVERAEESPVNEALWAWAYVALRDYDQALEWLEVAVDDQAPDLVTLGEIQANPYADPILDEPRFREIRDRIGT